MKKTTVVDSPGLQHPGNPHGLRWIEGDGGDKGGGGDDEDLEGLLDDDDSDDDSDEDGGDGDGDGDEITVTRQELADLVESAVDRRINAKVKRKIQGGGNARKKGSASWAPSRADLTDARSGYREGLDDLDFRFVSREERVLAQAIADAELSQLEEEDDPYEIGQEVAERVVDKIKAARKSYEDKVIARLRSRGVLKEREGQPSQSKARKTDKSKLTKGEERARTMYKDRMKQVEGES